MILIARPTKYLAVVFPVVVKNVLPADPLAELSIVKNQAATPAVPSRAVNRAFKLA